jgi:hypothetical protein
MTMHPHDPNLTAKGVMREDGIDWPIWYCTCGCGNWGARWP